MNEVQISFPDEGREGVVPVGTYLIDAAKRLGASVSECAVEGEHVCSIIINEGSDLLSPKTEVESEHLKGEPRDQNERLACFAKIDKPGVIVAMVKKKNEPAAEKEKPDERDEVYRKEFADLPLEKKIANLVQLEAMALSETFAFVINSPFKVFDKIGDVLAEFGFQKEEAEKRRARPAETKNGEAKSGSKKQKTSQPGKAPEQPQSS
ncbi:MAG: hypothetical protein ACJ72Z_03390 [Pyrinomonadaceae bacterium]